MDLRHKIDDIIEESWNIRRDDSKKAYSLVLEAAELSNNENYKLGLYSSYTVMGILQIYDGKYISAEEHLLKSIDYFTENPNPLYYSRTANTLGLCHLIQGDLGKALSYLQRGLEVSRKNNIDDVSIYMLHNIGEIYKDVSYFEEAIPYFLEAIKINKDNKHLLTFPIYSNIAICYQKIGNSELATKYIDDLTRFTESSTDTRSLSNYYELISDFKYEQGLYTEAEELCKKSLVIAKQVDEVYKIASAYLTLSKIYFSTKRYDLAIENAIYAIDICLENNVKTLLSSLYKIVSNSYFELNDFEKSSLYYRKFDIAYNEKITDTLNKRVIIMSSKLELESIKKDAEIHILKNIELKNKQEELTLIADIGHSIVNSLDIDEILDLIYKRINNFMDAPFFAVGSLLDNNHLVYTSIIRNSVRLPVVNVDGDTELSYGLQAIKENKTIYIKDINEKKNLPKNLSPTETGNIEVVSLLFCPLTIKNKQIGVFTIQSFEKNAYDEATINVLEGISSYIAIAINNAQKTKLLSDTAKDLEETLNELEETQTQLIQTEKLASLGQLVAGVAHELNTPIGSCITLNSYNQSQIKKFGEHMAENKLTKDEVNTFIDRSEKLTNVISDALEHASEMINSFKTVAIQQSELDIKVFNMSKFLSEFLLIINPLVTKHNSSINVICESKIEICNYPGVISQIFTQLVTNSIFHGFKNKPDGVIKINVSETKDELSIVYSDNGSGISEEIRPFIFDPFYGSNKIDGFMGLGLHSVHNLVTQILKGKIYLDDTYDETKFHITIKKNIK